MVSSRESSLVIRSLKPKLRCIISCLFSLCMPNVFLVSIISH
uniref:Uncharacterized protein n=1 Tax=Rhizophora mucronata TaxID=61149 RepID=A0A2P2PWX2_RHIMU